MSGGLAVNEDFLPVYCLHQTMTSPHEVEMEAGDGVEGETAATGELNGGEAQVEHKL